LCEGRSAEELLRESFLFLLERESNTSILTSFDLPLIGRYFPDYEQEIRTRLRRINMIASVPNPFVEVTGTKGFRMHP